MFERDSRHTNETFERDSRHSNEARNNNTISAAYACRISHKILL